MRVLVYGAGGVGLGLGSFLIEGGAQVHFVCRGSTVRALREHGLDREGRFGSAHADAGAFAASEALPGAGATEPFDLVLVTTKSNDSAAAARALAAGLQGGAPLVLCQNGWGNAETFAAHFPKERIWNARVITGFVRSEPHRVEVTAHAEPVAVGSLFGLDPAPLEPLCAALRRGGLPAETTTRIAEALWAKLLYNGCLNALGAILGVPYGALGGSQHTRGILDAVAREIFAVMHAAGHATRWPDADAWLASLYSELLPPTRDHESSTLQDLRAGKRTEIEALNGAVVRLGDELGIATPVNRTLCSIIRFLEERGAG